jgi:hypothetical protein
MARNYQAIDKAALPLVERAVARYASVCTDPLAKALIAKKKGDITPDYVAEVMLKDIEANLPPVFHAINYAYYKERLQVVSLSDQPTIDAIVVPSALAHLEKLEGLGLPESDEGSLVYWVGKWWPRAVELFAE